MMTTTIDFVLLRALPASIRTRILEAATSSPALTATADGNICAAITANSTNNSTSNPSVDDDNSNDLPSLFSELSIHEDAFSSTKYLTLKEIEVLQSCRIFILDSCLKTMDIAKDVEKDVVELQERKELKLGSMRNANQNTTMGHNEGASWASQTHRGDLIKWLHADQSLPSSIQTVLQMMKDVQSEINSIFPSFNSTSRQCQLAVYPGNAARYTRHCDTFKGGPMRRLTCIYYANTSWNEPDGGQLRAYVGVSGCEKLQSMTSYSNICWSTNQGYIDIAPIADRLVIFESAAIEHEVLPSNSNRIAITTWLG